MKSAFLAGLWSMSVSFLITLTRRNMQVSQVIMNALSDTWPFSLPPARLVCSLSLLHCLPLFLHPGTLQSLLQNQVYFPLAFLIIWQSSSSSVQGRSAVERCLRSDCGTMKMLSVPSLSSLIKH